MPASLTSGQVWMAIEKQMFAVLGTVTPKGQPRTAGIVYKVRDKTLYISTYYDSVKTKNVQHNPHVSLTVTVTKRIPFMPWIKTPAATITFQGRAQVHRFTEADAELQKLLVGNLKMDEKLLEGMALIEVQPLGNFVTYGIGVSLMDMRDPEKAQGRVSV